MAGAPDITLAFENEGPDMDTLVNFLMEEERRAEDGTLQEEREVAIDFYNGEPFGDEVDGRSQLVTRDVAEVIDDTVAELLDIMVSGDKVVEFTHPDKRVAEEATHAVGREFHDGQDGFRILQDWIKAGLLEKSSVAKVCVEHQPPKRREAVLSVEEMSAMAEQGVQFIASAQMDDEGQQWGVAWLEPQAPKFRDYVTPNEEFGVASDARDLDNGCIYDVFKMRKTLSEIAAMGYDASDLWDDGNESLTTLSSVRDDGQNENIVDYRTGANRAVWFLEEYARYDLNGDGIAELLKVHRVGKTILDVEEVDEQPGVVWCPFPMPGRITGHSLADKVMDIQRTRSVALRQTMDGFYFQNNPRVWLNESSQGDTTIDDLLTSNRPGGVVRWIGSIKPEVSTSSFDIGSGITLMEMLAGEKESRSGVTRLNQGMTNPDSLNKTATGTKLMQQAGKKIARLITRNFAEAFARLMLKKYRLMRQFGRPFEIVIDGEQRTVDPRNWPEDMNIRVKVGLGTGDKDEMIQRFMMLLGVAQEAIAGGSRVFNDTNVYNIVRSLVEAGNLGNVRELITDPDSLPPAEEKPDPKMMEVQAKSMLEAQKLDQQARQAAFDNELKARQQEHDAALAAQRNEYDLASKREKSALEQDLARQKAEFEASLALRQQQFEEDMAERRFAFDQEMASRKAEADEALPKKRPGGRLDA
ncbi:hypothetical protein [Sphingobium fuliginis]|jgi:hypothetical protein|uniref:portal protein n=1 Tax=Sphingobium fuliginis (strain ATCC 27551) TaxID=336203 RepID=UPI0037CBECB9